MRSPKDVEKDEYNEFYKKTFNEFLEPLAYTQFTTEVCWWFWLLAERSISFMLLSIWLGFKLCRVRLSSEAFYMFQEWDLLTMKK